VPAVVKGAPPAAIGCRERHSRRDALLLPWVEQPRLHTGAQASSLRFGKTMAYWILDGTLLSTVRWCAVVQLTGALQVRLRPR